MRIERAYEEEPANWERVEVEVEVDENGNVVATQIVERSDRDSLNSAAFEAVVRTLKSTPLPPRAARVRFAVEAGIVVQPPTVSKSALDPRGRGVVGTMKLRFDETTGKVQPRPWFLRRLVTRVSVVSATNQAPPQSR